MFVESSKASRQVVQGAAENGHIVGVSEVLNQGGLCWLLGEVVTEMRPTESTAQPLLALAEEVLGGVVGALDEAEDRTVLVVQGGGCPKR